MGNIRLRELALEVGSGQKNPLPLQYNSIAQVAFSWMLY